MPIQPIGGHGVEGTIDVLPEYSAGLKDLEGFSHVYVLYHLHEIVGFDLMVKPFLDTDRHGIFATARPSAPTRSGFRSCGSRACPATRCSLNALTC